MDNLTSAKGDVAGSVAALKEPHLWIMALLYIGTFGSFIGFAGVFPKLIKDYFPAFSSIGVGTVAPLAGLPRPAGGFAGPPLRRTHGRPHGRRPHDRGRLRRPWPSITLTMIWTLPLKNFWLFLGLFLMLFTASGFGNGATYRMIPVIFAPPAGRRHGADRGDPAPGVLGPRPHLGHRRLRRIRDPAGAERLQASGAYTPAFYGFVGAYVLMLVVCWASTSATPTEMRWDTSNMTKSADTHCPYCALQCAMTLKSPAG